MLKEGVLKKNILVLVEHFGQGGAERVAAMLAQMLHEDNRFNVWFYAVYYTESLPVIAGIDAGSLDIKMPSGRIAKAANYYKKMVALEALKQRLKIDITISSLWPADWINAVTGKDKKIAISQINILNNPQNVQMVKYRWLVTKVYKRFDRIVLGGSNLVGELRDYFHISAGKLQVIYNPIDTALIEKNIQASPAKKIEDTLNTYRICVVANRLHPIKNNAALVPIYKQLANKTGVKFLIIGEGEDKPAIQNLLVQEGLLWSQLEDKNFSEEAHFYFLNFQQNIHNIISRSAAFLFPTMSEGMPLALLEAMYCGVPVVVSDCPVGGVSEAVGGKEPFNAERPRHLSEALPGGYLMPIPIAENKEAITVWKDTIEAVLNADEETRAKIKKANQSRAKQFDKSAVKEKWTALLAEIDEP